MSIGKIISLCGPLLFFYNIAHANVDLHIIDFCKRCGLNRTDKLSYQVAYWDETSTLPNPCFGQGWNCTIGVGFQPGNGEATQGVLLGRDALNGSHGIQNVATMGGVAKIYSRTFGFGSTQITEGSGFGDAKLCYAMKWKKGNAPVNLVPGAYCAYTNPGPPLNACYINGPITIDHGTVNTGSASTRTVTSTVFCLEKARVRLRFLNLVNDRLSLGSGGVTSKLSLNGNSGTQGTLVNVEKGRNAEFQVASYIESIPEGNTGLKQGSATLTLDFP